MNKTLLVSGIIISIVVIIAIVIFVVTKNKSNNSLIQPHSPQTSPPSSSSPTINIQPVPQKSHALFASYGSTLPIFMSNDVSTSTITKTQNEIPAGTLITSEPFYLNSTFKMTGLCIPFVYINDVQSYNAIGVNIPSVSLVNVLDPSTSIITFKFTTGVPVLNNLNFGAIYGFTGTLNLPPANYMFVFVSNVPIKLNKFANNTLPFFAVGSLIQRQSNISINAFGQKYGTMLPTFPSTYTLSTNKTNIKLPSKITSMPFTVTSSFSTNGIFIPAIQNKSGYQYEPISYDAAINLVDTKTNTTVAIIDLSKLTPKVTYGDNFLTHGYYFDYNITLSPSTYVLTVSPPDSYSYVQTFDNSTDVPFFFTGSKVVLSGNLSTYFTTTPILPSQNSNTLTNNATSILTPLSQNLTLTPFSVNSDFNVAGLFLPVMYDSSVSSVYPINFTSFLNYFNGINLVDTVTSNVLLSITFQNSSYTITKGNLINNQSTFYNNAAYTPVTINNYLQGYIYPLPTIINSNPNNVQIKLVGYGSSSGKPITVRTFDNSSEIPLFFVGK